MSGEEFGRRRWLGDAMVAGRPLSRVFDAACLIVFGVALLLAGFWLGARDDRSGWLPVIGVAAIFYGLYVFFTRGRYWVSTLVYLVAGLFVVYLVAGRETDSPQESDRRPSPGLTSEPETRSTSPGPTSGPARTQLTVDAYITLLRQGRIRTATIFAAERRIEGTYDRGEYAVDMPPGGEAVFSRVTSALEDAGVPHTVR
jgi:hypothetical protein